MSIFISAAMIPVTFFLIQKVICEPISAGLKKFMPGGFSDALTKKRFE